MKHKYIENYLNKINIYKCILYALLITNTLTYTIIYITIDSSYFRGLLINSICTVIGVLISLVPAQNLYKDLIDEKKNLTVFYNTDALTGLLSRKPMLDLIKNKLENYNYNLPLSLTILDIDHFKLVNDLYGHQAGDEVMTYIGGILADNIDDNCIIGRFGGEEFVVFSFNKTEETIIENLYDLRKKLDTHYIYKNKPIDFTASFGCIINRNVDVDIKRLLKEADENLFLAKVNGRNRVEYNFLSNQGVCNVFKTN